MGAGTLHYQEITTMILRWNLLEVVWQYDKLDIGYWILDIDYWLLIIEY